MMKIVCLGSGTSVGIPAIGCNCAVCLSSDPRNKRRRTSLYLHAGGRHVIVDTPPDFREQVLQYEVPRVDAVLFTHSHADHILGFDDIRRFNTIQDCVIPAYGPAETISDLKRIFDYVHTEKVPGLYRPRIAFHELSGPVPLGGDLNATPLPVSHGSKQTVGYLFTCNGRSLGYVPDCFEMGDDVVNLVKGVDVMILDALRHRDHKTHLTLEGSVSLLQRIGAKRSYLIHMCHDLDHAETEKGLPENIRLAYDGLTLEW